MDQRDSQSGIDDQSFAGSFSGQPDEKAQANKAITLRAQRILANAKTTLAQVIRDPRYGASTVINLRRIMEALPTNHDLEHLSELLMELAGMMEERGYRDYFYIQTPREHAAIGSTLPEEFKSEDLDIPTGISRPDLNIRKRLSFEEIDHARRLAGLPILDPATKKAMQKIDQLAANDPYYFIDPERRAAMVLRESEILDEIARIAAMAIVEF